MCVWDRKECVGRCVSVCSVAEEWRHKGQRASLCGSISPIEPLPIAYFGIHMCYAQSGLFSLAETRGQNVPCLQPGCLCDWPITTIPTWTFVCSHVPPSTFVMHLFQTAHPVVVFSFIILILPSFLFLVQLLDLSCSTIPLKQQSPFSLSTPLHTVNP